MIESLATLNPVWQSISGNMFYWFVTALGAAMVFFFKEISRKTLDGMLGFAAGVMIAASFWSLLAPAIDLSEQMGFIPWVPPLVGFFGRRRVPAHCG